MSLNLDQFHQTFFEESFELIDDMEAALLSLDVGAPDAESINTVFRAAHSIKGGAGMFNFTDIAGFTHVLETLLDQLRSDRLDVTQDLSNMLLESVDVMRTLLTAAQTGTAPDETAISDLKKRLAEAGDCDSHSAAADDAPKSVAGMTTPKEPASGGPTQAVASLQPHWQIAFKPGPELLTRGNDPVRIFAELEQLGDLDVRARAGAIPELAKLDPTRSYFAWELRLYSDCARAELDDIFEWSEGDCELEIVRVGGEKVEQAASASVGATDAADPAAVRPAEAAAAPPVAAAKTDTKSPTRGESGSIRVNIEKIDELLNFVGEIVITQSMLTQLGCGIDGPSGDEMQSALTQLERNVRELQESVMRVRMLPISSVFSRFPRLVRDVSQRLEKKIELKMTGQETELDKTVLEKIGDPLVHLIRNSIDHGIEKPVDRVAAGKKETGTVHLNAYHKGGSITIEVIDDGKGLDRDKIVAKARSRGLIGSAENMSDEQVYDLLFTPGFSTAEQTTDLSGRGVGMDVVRRNIKELGGTIELRSELGRGSYTCITLPLTLAIIDGQSVAVGDEVYIVPLTGIVESLQLQEGMANKLVSQGEVFSFRGTYLPVIRLHEVFDVKPRTSQLHEGLIMVVEGDGRKVGLFVDDLLGQQQVVIKSTETNYRRIDGISGATILGDGSVALILDVPGLIRVAGESLSTHEAA